MLSACSDYRRIEPDGDRSSTDFFVSTTDNAAKAANLPILREVPLDEELTEIRIWVGFGPMIIQSMYRIYKLDNGQIDGEHIWHFDPPLEYWTKEEADEFYQETYEDCNTIGVFQETESCKVNFDNNTNWDNIYKDLNKYDIWNMPDSSEIPELQNKDGLVYVDGMSIVIELKKKGLYRLIGHKMNPAHMDKKYHYAREIMNIIIKNK